MLSQNVDVSSNVGIFSILAGDVNLFFNDTENLRSCEINIMVANSDCRRKGIGKEAVLLMMFYGLTRLEVNRFYCKVHSDNKPSLHLFSR